jgi:hypothetical protein
MKISRRGIAEAIAGGLALICLSGAFGTNAFPEIRTRRVIIVDEFGREVGFLAGANGQARLELHNLTTRNSAIVATEAEAFVMLGIAEKSRVRLFNKGELSALEIRDEQGKLRVLAGISDKDKPKIILRGADDTPLWSAPPDEPNEENKNDEKDYQAKGDSL